MATTRPTADRNIHFYRLDGGAPESGVPHKVNLEPALKYISELPFKKEGGRYLLQPDGSLHCCWIDRAGDAARFQFGTIRRNALPQAESLGERRNLQLAEEEGLCEICHVCVFPNDIVGVEYNFYGPRASRIAAYINKVAAGYCREFKLEALMRRDTSEKLRRKCAVRALELKVRRPYIDVIKSIHKPTGAALESLAQGSDADTIGVILGPEPYQRVNLADGMLGFIHRLVRRSDLRENVQQFKATVVDEQTEKTDIVNLLQDHLISSRKILRISERSRVLDSEHAYCSIEDSFAELREDLLSAASVTV